MKRIIAVILAVLMIAALLAACGDSKDTDRTVKTTVSQTYDDGYAKDFAKSTNTDDSGNTVYEFTGEKYDDYIYRHNNVISQDIAADVTAKYGNDYGQYVLLSAEKKAVIIGVNPGKYVAADAEADAPAFASKAWAYFQSLETPVSTVSVIFCNANNQDEVYGTFSVSL